MSWERQKAVARDEEDFRNDDAASRPDAAIISCAELFHEKASRAFDSIQSSGIAGWWDVAKTRLTRPA